MKAWWNAVSVRQQSTRSAAIYRIGVALILWSRFANELQPFRHLEWHWRGFGVWFFASTLALLVGWHSRVAAVSTALWALTMYVVYGFWLDVEPYRHHHTHMLMAACVVCALLPVGKSLSVDRWLALREAERTGGPVPDERGWMLPLRLAGLQCSVAYALSATDKCSWAFLSGERLQAIFVGKYAVVSLPDVWWVTALFATMAIATVVLEFVLPVGLFVRRWQWFLVPLGLAMHAAFYYLLPVSTFSVNMALMYLGYVDPDAVERVWRRLAVPSAGDPAVAPSEV